MTKHPDLMAQAIEFRTVMGQPVDVFTREISNLQGSLIEEECQEFVEALQMAIGSIQNSRAREDALKELADLVYVAFQAAAALGGNSMKPLTGFTRATSRNWSMASR